MQASGIPGHLSQQMRKLNTSVKGLEHYVDQHLDIIDEDLKMGIQDLNKTQRDQNVTKMQATLSSANNTLVVVLDHLEKINMEVISRVQDMETKIECLQNDLLKSQKETEGQQKGLQTVGVGCCSCCIVGVVGLGVGFAAISAVKGATAIVLGVSAGSLAAGSGCVGMAGIAIPRNR